MSTEEIEGVDSGFSDAAPNAFSEDSQEPLISRKNSQHRAEVNGTGNSSAISAVMSAEDEDAILEDAADLNLPKEEQNNQLDTTGNSSMVCIVYML